MTQNALNYGGISIPGTQAQPPAGHDDIAFRPGCLQVQSILQANGMVAHTIALPNGRIRILAEMPPMDGDRALLYLDTAGLCKVGGVDVPIIMADQLPQQSIARVSASVSGAPPIAIDATGEGGGSFPVMPIAIGGGVLAIAALLFIALQRRRPSGVRPPIVTPPPSSPAPAPESDGGESLIDSLF